MSPRDWRKQRRKGYRDYRASFEKRPRRRLVLRNRPKTDELDAMADAVWLLENTNTQVWVITDDVPQYERMLRAVGIVVGGDTDRMERMIRVPPSDQRLTGNFNRHFSNYPVDKNLMAEVVRWQNDPARYAQWAYQVVKEYLDVPMGDKASRFIHRLIEASGLSGRIQVHRRDLE